MSSRRAALEANAARFAADRQRLEGQRAQQARILTEGKDAGERAKAAEAQLQDAEAQAGLSAYAQALRPGEPCPLCGQPVDAAHLPVHPSAAEVERLRQAVSAAVTLRDDLRAQYKETTAELGVLDKDLQRREAELSDTAEQLTQDEADNRAAAERIAGNPAEQVARLLAGLAEQVRSFGAQPGAERQKAQAHIGELRRAVSDTAQALSAAASAAAAAQATLGSAQASAAARRAEAAEDRRTERSARRFKSRRVREFLAACSPAERAKYAAALGQKNQAAR